MKKSICLFAFLCLFCHPVCAEISAVDGDSLVVDGGRVRMEGIDAPEFFQVCRKADGTEYECGKSSLEYLKKLIEQNDVSCRCAPKPDRYGRQLCECFAGDMSLNAEMVRAGHAVRYRSDKYITEEKEAKRQKRGVWQGKFMRPALYRILHRRK